MRIHTSSHKSRGRRWGAVALAVPMIYLGMHTLAAILPAVNEPTWFQAVGLSALVYAVGLLLNTSALTQTRLDADRRDGSG